MRRLYKQIEGHNIIGLTVIHNGLKGGDAGHGGFIRIEIEDYASTSMEVNGDAECQKIVLTIRGDSERETFIEAFKAIIDELESYPNG